MPTEIQEDFWDAEKRSFSHAKPGGFEHARNPAGFLRTPYGDGSWTPTKLDSEQATNPEQSEIFIAAVVLDERRPLLCAQLQVFKGLVEAGIELLGARVEGD